VNHFAEYLQQRWDEGCHNAAQLYREIREKGYLGKRAMLARLVANWRKGGKTSRPNAPERISPKHAAILVTRAADQMTEAQQRLFDRISAQCPAVIELRQMALAFRTALTGGDAAKLRLWVEGARHCEYGSVVRFAYGCFWQLGLNPNSETLSSGTVCSERSCKWERDGSEGIRWRSVRWRWIAFVNAITWSPFQKNWVFIDVYSTNGDSS